MGGARGTFLVSSWYPFARESFTVAVAATNHILYRVRHNGITELQNLVQSME